MPVEFHGPLGKPQGVSFCCVPSVDVAANKLKEKGLLGCRIGTRQAGIDFYRSPEHVLRVDKILPGALVGVPKASLVPPPGAQIVGRRRPCPLVFGLAELGLNRTY